MRSKLLRLLIVHIQAKLPVYNVKLLNWRKYFERYWIVINYTSDLDYEFEHFEIILNFFKKKIMWDAIDEIEVNEVKKFDEISYSNFFASNIETYNITDIQKSFLIDLYNDLLVLFRILILLWNELSWDE
jgi:hypothetical protein